MVLRWLCLVGLVLGFVFVNASSAFAWQTENGECKGQIRGGPHEKITLNADSNAFPAGSAEREALEYAVREWNFLYGVADRFDLRFTSTGGARTDNGVSEVSISSTDADGDSLPNTTLGRYHSQFDSCNLWWFNDGALNEVDIVINFNKIADGTIDVGAASCIDADTIYLGSVLLHELGHALGAGHDSTRYAVMQESVSNTHGQYCGHYNDEWDPEHRSNSAPHPDDVAFANKYHGTGVDAQDPTLSNYHSPTDDIVEFVDNGSESGTYTVTKCPGDEVELNFAVGSRGTASFSGAKWRVWFTEDEHRYHDRDTVVKSGIASLYPGDFIAITPRIGWTFTVPTDASVGTYNIIVEINYNRYDSGIYEPLQGHNNMILMPKQVEVILSPSHCS